MTRLKRTRHTVFVVFFGERLITIKTAGIVNQFTVVLSFDSISDQRFFVKGVSSQES